jgi:hypothetical protein
MEVLDINNFISFKTDINTFELDNSILDSFNLLFGHLDKNKKNKKCIKKTNINILKNQKIQNKKEIISNKVNLILNKLSESNIDCLIIEFIQNINQVDSETFNEIQKTFYLKIISEINFIKIYIQFLKILAFIYNKVQNYNLSYFYSIVESKFMLDYSDYDIEIGSEFDFIKVNNGELTRINNLILIKNLVENNMLSNIIYDLCDKVDHAHGLSIYFSIIFSVIIGFDVNAPQHHGLSIYFSINSKVIFSLYDIFFQSQSL